jgi:hypothetical protein
MLQNLMEYSERLAADLAGGRVDANEAQKALAYLRNARDTDAYFAYLRAIVKDGRVVIRSAQTLDYYRNLLDASERHLRGLSADDAVHVLGWAIRLLRYLRVVPDAEFARRPVPTTGSSQTSTSPSAVAPTEKPTPAPPALPKVGDQFGVKVLELIDIGVVVALPRHDPEHVIGLIRSEQLGGVRYKADDAAYVEVLDVKTRKSGLVVVELKRVKKQKT